MQCRKCKTELPDGAAYCYVCGVKQGKSQKRTKARGNGTGCVYKLPNGKWHFEAGWQLHRGQTEHCAEQTAGSIPS